MFKAIKNLLPTIIGTAQSILPLVKELLVVIIRIIAILPFLWSKADPIIDKINTVYNIIYSTIEKAKNWLL